MNRPNWYEYYMEIAITVSKKSPDFIKVGSVLISNKDNRIISTGYNSTPVGVDNNKIDFNNRDLIKKIMIHSEINSILYKNGYHEDCTLFVTRSPCCRCILILSAAKVSKIIYKTPHKDFIESLELCKFFNIELIKF